MAGVCWELISVNVGDVQRFLNEGWEPFAVTNETKPERTNGPRVWLRRSRKVKAK